MDSKELRNLQEAYLEVVNGQQLDEAVKGEDSEMRRAAAAERRSGYKKVSPSKVKDYVKQQKKDISYMDKLTKKNKDIVGTTQEEVSVYDIVLSHLLDEGYAETPEAAEAIMVNMSEEWRDSIVDETINEGRRTSLSALSRESQQRKADKERGRPETQDEKHRRLAMGRYSPSQYKWEKVDGRWKNMGRKDGEED